MPLTPFQEEVLAVLAANRSEDSHFAGGLVLNAGDDSARFSRDFDLFHDAAAEVVRASADDVARRQAAGFTVEPVLRGSEWNPEAEPTFRKAAVHGPGGSVEIDWAADSAFRPCP